MRLTFDPLGTLAFVVGSGIVTGATGEYSLGRHVLMLAGLGLVALKVTYRER